MKILIAPLDWGLGHATRCIPIIRYLIDTGCEVVIGADGRALELLRSEFHLCEFAVIRGYRIYYPVKVPLAIGMFLQIPKILWGILREHKQLKRIIKEKSIDAVISDNRFGLWSRKVPSVFITHQLMVKSPFGEKIIYKCIQKCISNYTECWVPDSVKEQLSGDLANKHPIAGNVKFIGVLSRFFPDEDEASPTIDLLVLLSGPEPQRSVFEKKIIRQLQSPIFQRSGFNVLIVQGVTGKRTRINLAENISMVSYLLSEELRKVLISSALVLTRPGYSTVMDVAVLSRKAIFVPTPGQTEQEYLARRYAEKKIAYSVSQKQFDLTIALREAKKYTGFERKYSTEEFKNTVGRFLRN
jgi:Glycosyltransferase family 28 C-terminal domain